MEPTLAPLTHYSVAAPPPSTPSGEIGHQHLFASLILSQHDPESSLVMQVHPGSTATAMPPSLR
jgi:hypothetical protein